MHMKVVYMSMKGMVRGIGESVRYIQASICEHIGRLVTAVVLFPSPSI